MKSSDIVYHRVTVTRDMRIQLNGNKVMICDDEGKVLELCDEAFIVPSDNTGRIQEAYITAGHALMECIEECLLKAERRTSY